MTQQGLLSLAPPPTAQSPLSTEVKVKVKHLFQAIHVIHRKQTMFNSKLLYAWSRRNSLRCIKFPATRVQLMRTGHGICSP